MAAVANQKVGRWMALKEVVPYMTIRAVNRHFNFKSGNSTEKSIGFRECVREVDYAGDGGYETFREGWGYAPFYCFDDVEEVSFYNNYRDVTDRRSHIFVSVEKCVSESWCETDQQKIDEFWSDIQFLFMAFND